MRTASFAAIVLGFLTIILSTGLLSHWSGYSDGYERAKEECRRDKINEDEYRRRTAVSSYVPIQVKPAYQPIMIEPKYRPIAVAAVAQPYTYGAKFVERNPNYNPADEIEFQRRVASIVKAILAEVHAAKPEQGPMPRVVGK